ncbi:hypothetical protein HNQ59_000288 [Chitinivorax tropicus]|uniref:Uncharacterized protein n=1 Tax=Chitinivorax tropicus TaxID=714531 RepID=A0A840MKD3_9PROT|nr:hypothetical protein [Chitinivorax tropicus]
MPIGAPIRPQPSWRLIVAPDALCCYGGMQVCTIVQQVSRGDSQTIKTTPTESRVYQCLVAIGLAIEEDDFW